MREQMNLSTVLIGVTVVYGIYAFLGSSAPLNPLQPAVHAKMDPRLEPKKSMKRKLIEDVGNPVLHKRNKTQGGYEASTGTYIENVTHKSLEQESQDVYSNLAESAQLLTNTSQKVAAQELSGADELLTPDMQTKLKGVLKRPKGELQEGFNALRGTFKGMADRFVQFQEQVRTLGEDP